MGCSCIVAGLVGAGIMLVVLAIIIVIFIGLSLNADNRHW